jgi:hypothetical protein
MGLGPKKQRLSLYTIGLWAVHKILGACAVPPATLAQGRHAHLYELSSAPGMIQGSHTLQL